MTGFAPVSVRLPVRSIALLQEVADLHQVSRHRLMEAVLRYAARNPDGLARQALCEAPQKHELNRLVANVGPKA